jgi:hypothetical protein
MPMVLALGRFAAMPSPQSPRRPCAILPAMQRSRVVHAGGVAGLSALGAVIAHAGPAAIADRRWMAAAAAGALVAFGALTVAARVVLGFRRGARRILDGDLVAGLECLPERLSFSALVGVTLMCQAWAHAAFLAIGVPAHAGGPEGSVALHVLLAVAAAAIIALVDRVVYGAAETFARVMARAAALLSRGAALPRLAAADVCRCLRLLPGAVHGRAPPPVPAAT